MLGVWVRINKVFRIYVEGQFSTYPYPPDPDLQYSFITACILPVETEIQCGNSAALLYKDSGSRWNRAYVN